MKHLIFEHIYLGILLEEKINDPALIEAIASLPAPFNAYLENMRSAMAEAINAKTDQDRIDVNTKVNVWRDKLVEAWRENGKDLTPEQDQLMGDAMIDIINDYTTFMGGFNTGYAA